MHIFYTVSSLVFVLSGVLAEAAPSASIVDLQGARSKCQATFFHFGEEADLALVPTRCLDNLITGGVSARGIRSTRVIVHPAVEKAKLLDPTFVSPEYDLSVVSFPRGTTDAVSPLAPVAPKLTQAELAFTAESSPSVLPSITDQPSVSLADLKPTSGHPLHDALGRVLGVVTNCAEKDGKLQCQTSSLHNVNAFELLWHAKRKLGASTANYRIPSVDVQRAELCGLFRRRAACPQPACRPACTPPPQTVYCDRRPVAVYPAPAPQANHTTQQQAVQSANQRMQNSQTNNQTATQSNPQTNTQAVDNRHNFNVSPNNSSRSESNPTITVNPRINNNPVIHFNPTINVPVANNNGGGPISQGGTSSSSGANEDTLAAYRAAEERLYQERESLARRRQHAEEVVAQERRTFEMESTRQQAEADSIRQRQQEELARHQRDRQKAEELRAQQQGELKQLKEQNAELNRQREAAEAEAKLQREQQEQAIREAEQAREEAARLREVGRQITQASLLQQGEVDESKITGKESVARLPKGTAVNYALAYDRSPAVPQGKFEPTLSGLLAKNASQLDGSSTAFGEKAFFASLPSGMRSRAGLIEGMGVSESQVTALVASYTEEHRTFAQYLASSEASTPWWNALGDARDARVLGAQTLSREEYVGARRLGADPSLLF